jgi:hypothetical protein
VYDNANFASADSIDAIFLLQASSASRIPRVDRVGGFSFRTFGLKFEFCLRQEP